MILPKYLFRVDDFEPFVLIGDKYYLESSVLSWPDNLHTGYKYETLKGLGWTEKPLEVKKKTREQHIAEFWESFYKSIESAHGAIRYWGPDSTLQEIADVLAQNNIRFTYKR